MGILKMLLNKISSECEKTEKVMNREIAKDMQRYLDKLNGVEHEVVEDDSSVECIDPEMAQKMQNYLDKLNGNK